MQIRQIIYKLLWSFALLFIIITAIILSLGFILAAALVGAMALGVYGIYRYYLMKRGRRKFKTKPYRYVNAEVIHDTIEVKEPEIMEEKIYWIKRQ